MKVFNLIQSEKIIILSQLTKCFQFDKEFHFVYSRISNLKGEFKMKTVDLHVHSSCSDGTLTPTELIILAKSQGLSAMAMTDHDTIVGISEAMAAGKEYNIEVVPGIELSCAYGSKEIHILGLYVDYKDRFFNDELENLRTIRTERNLQIIEKFKSFGIEISFEEMKQLYGNAVVTRAHFADYLLLKGYIKSRNEAFERYIGDNRPCYMPREKLTPEQTIRLITEAGGVPILAHPTLYHLGGAEMNKLIHYLCRSGLVGIEAIYSTYSIGEEIQMRKLAKENHLIISGGSDYHGANKPYINLGTGRGHLCIPYDVLDNIKHIAGK